MQAEGYHGEFRLRKNCVDPDWLVSLNVNNIELGIEQYQIPNLCFLYMKVGCH